MRFAAWFDVRTVVAVSRDASGAPAGERKLLDIVLAGVYASQSNKA